MSDLASLRAEIKQWERQFRAKEGRDPDVNEIKKRPEIAQKYKQYKRLQKAAKESKAAPEATSSGSRTPPPPATPSRNGGKRATALSTKRVLGSTGPLSTFNPFSPQKAKAKDQFPIAPKTPRPLSNPFTSPVKSRPRIEQPVFLPTGASNSRFTSTPEPPNTISRARKRLRGEPVSPSPNKEKRRRKTSPELSLPFPKLTFNMPDSDDDEEDAETLVGNSSFVDDSPVKPVPSARGFTTLFEDTAIPSGDIFGLNKRPASAATEADVFDGPLPGSSTQPGQRRAVKQPKNAKASNAKSKIFPQANGKQQTLTQFLSGPKTSSDKSRAISEGPQSVPSGSATPSEEDPSTRSPKPRSKSPLLPPSPPATGTTSSITYKNKGKRKADPNGVDGRKKAKMAADEQSEDDTTSDDLAGKVKVVHRARTVEVASDDDMGSDYDPVLTYLRHGKQQGSHLSSQTRPDTTTTVIDLPDKLRNVLALDADTTSTDREAEKVFQSLVYRRRVSQYDPKKGEIWDVGEEEGSDGEGKLAGEDDEWEGEPVPWEVAEL
ncbi:hypothetical protein CC1G_01770 [Coprinopsis cinerea okayama7|uniref:DNA replication regulator SLD2 n=1 Tax=Coprinopsis cinerea (strain Okayama-7 / 130 / ATCC MYA-4618 / FGSC 9003) TaxID=240176 RepID=A8N2D1_COPC7|nr:hypothetical protein CC1G_01770 [Coprinopsis cinerea okayama7\|eukprot:XP_001829090.1 hypothetical protein CC1G_01770 [Coprinopsis cinerea okayama7\